MSWTNLQKGILKSYQRYAGLADPDYRALLHQQTGATSSRDAHLTQYHFDALMPLLEIRAHLAETNGRAVGRKPPKLTDWYYWRNRSPERGKASSRELWKISNAQGSGLWDLLTPYLPESERTEHYLRAIAAHACGLRKVEHLHELTVGQCGMLIEALKDRLSHAIRRAG
jgi:hypothetical protein